MTRPITTTTTPAPSITFETASTALLNAESLTQERHASRWTGRPDGQPGLDVPASPRHGVTRARTPERVGESKVRGFAADTERRGPADRRGVGGRLRRAGARPVRGGSSGGSPPS